MVRQVLTAVAAFVLAIVSAQPVAAAATAQWPFGGPLPGAPPFDESLIQRLQAAWASRPPQYRPRTRHLRADGSPQYANRLFLEASPYLLQHAHNPVNWYPWGEEAFETAKKLNRPVLLSIGYSTCHWCHVMEEESFEDETIARDLNEHYIAIKVDREERPDIDAIYMTAVQMLTGGGGWPLNVWVTPERKPFYGGTYFPARDGQRGYTIGFATLLQRLRQAYDQQPARIAETSSEIVQAIQANLSYRPLATGPPGAPALREAYDEYRFNFDDTYGGINGAPKFPSGLSVRFLLRYHRRSDDAQALEMATRTLEKMAAGGIYDHIGGGFHRYATDDHWLVPHFEKMLYDNALLALAYIEGYQVTGREDFARVAREILRYVTRDMTSPQGAFFSATDADSPAPSGKREEGWFFTWTPQELQAVLNPEDARAVEAYYGVTSHGNFEGRNILHASRSLPEVARELKLSPEALASRLEEAKERLYVARSQRPAPHRDEKILTAWNGLMIRAYAQAALILGEPAYAGQAGKAADFILTHLRQEGRLLRSYKDGRAAVNAYLDDYACLIAGLLDLYEATHELRWLKEALALDTVLERSYEDSERGGYFMTSHDHEALLAREKPAYDGAEPSGNSVQALNLLRLYEFTAEERYRQRAEGTLQAFGERLARTPTALSEMLLALDFYLDTPKEVAIVVPRSRAEAEPFLDRLRATFLPNRMLAIAAEGEDSEALGPIAPLLEGRKARDGKATAYVCEHQICQLPTTDPEVFARQIVKVQPLPDTQQR